ncbi:hypothetical protein ABE099_17110 [Paenibacillus turicensis]|uniref:hypothetical protein n=1 Tax=Paenibacillus turicensis TaxID=160487 RepID=UPI003D27BCFA
MTNKYLKFGIQNEDMQLVTEELQKILNISFEEHESSYWGEYNIAKLSKSESIRLIYNNYMDDDWQEEDFKQYPLLLEFNGINEPEKMLYLLCENLPYISLLYMDEFDGDDSFKRYIFENGEFVLDQED